MLKRTVGDSDVTNVSTTLAVVIFRVKVILYHQWMVVLSLVIDLIGISSIYFNVHYGFVILVRTDCGWSAS